jgi:hypothetical protein
VGRGFSRDIPAWKSGALAPEAPSCSGLTVDDVFLVRMAHLAGAVFDSCDSVRPNLFAVAKPIRQKWLCYGQLILSLDVIVDTA